MNRNLYKYVEFFQMKVHIVLDIGIIM